MSAIEVVYYFDFAEVDLPSTRRRVTGAIGTVCCSDYHHIAPPERLCRIASTIGTVWSPDYIVWGLQSHRPHRKCHRNGICSDYQGRGLLCSRSEHHKCYRNGAWFRPPPSTRPDTDGIADRKHRQNTIS